MTDQDVMVAKPPVDSDEGRPDRSLAEQLVEQARVPTGSISSAPAGCWPA